MDRAAIRAQVRARVAVVEAPVPFTVRGLGPVFVKLMSAKRAKANAEYLKTENTQDRIVAAVACTLCDESGDLVYDVTDADDLAELEGLGMEELSAIVREANRLNAQSDEGAAEAGNV